MSQRIFSTLQRYERLSLPRLKLHSRLTDRQLRHSLAAMIHHHLVYNFTSLEDGNTYYEANPQSAYYLVRSGKILRLIENSLGEYAARVMETVMFLGHASVKHLETLPELRTLQSTVPNGVSQDDEQPQENGLEEEAVTDELNGHRAPEEKPAPFHSTMRALASHGYLMRVRDAQFQSPSDNLLEARRTAAAQSDIKALKGKKQEESILLRSQELVSERTHSDLTEGLMVGGLPRGIKRKFDHASSRLPNGQPADDNGTNGDHAAEEDEEENEWSEDEDGFDNIPMEVSRSHVLTDYFHLFDTDVAPAVRTGGSGQLREIRCRVTEYPVCQSRRTGCAVCHRRDIRMSTSSYRIRDISLSGFL